MERREVEVGGGVDRPRDKGNKYTVLIRFQRVLKRNETWNQSRFLLKQIADGMRIRTRDATHCWFAKNKQKSCL